MTAGVPLQERIPVAAPDHLDGVPAGPSEYPLQFLNDLAVAAYRTVEALQVAVDHEHQIVEIFPSGERDGAQAFRLVHLAIAAEHPDLAALGLSKAAVLEVFS